MEKQNWLSEIAASPQFGTVIESARKNRAAAVFGLHPVHTALLAAGVCQELSRDVVVVCESDAEAARMAADCGFFSGGAACSFPARDLVFLEVEGVSHEAEQARLQTLARLSDSGTAVDTPCDPLPRPDESEQKPRRTKQNIGAGAGLASGATVFQSKVSARTPYRVWSEPSGELPASSGWEAPVKAPADGLRTQGIKERVPISQYPGTELFGSGVRPSSGWEAPKQRPKAAAEPKKPAAQPDAGWEAPAYAPIDYSKKRRTSLPGSTLSHTSEKTAGLGSSATVWGSAKKPKPAAGSDRFESPKGTRSDARESAAAPLPAAKRNPLIVCCSLEGLTLKTLRPDALQKAGFTVLRGDCINLRETALKLVMAGYTRCDTVEGSGSFSVRGGILDVFPSGASQPVRIELWGDEVYSIRPFDPETQRRQGEQAGVRIPPAREVLCGDPAKSAALLRRLLPKVKTDRERELWERDITLLESGAIPAVTDRYAPILGADGALGDYLPDAVWVFQAPAALQARARELEVRRKEEFAAFAEQGLTSLTARNFHHPFTLHCEGKGAIYADVFARTLSDIPLDSLTTIRALPTVRREGGFGELKEQINGYLEDGWAVILLAATDKEADGLCRDLVAGGISALRMTSRTALTARTVAVGVGTLSSGFELPACRLALIAGAKTAVRRVPAGKPKKKTEMFGSLADLVLGDYVVHSTQGIGIFRGIERVDHHGMVRDYIKIQYAGADVLYVPVDQLDLVSPYVAPDTDRKPALGRLRSGDWQRTKKAVYRSVREMAKELIALYAKREKAEGVAFTSDDDLQRDFEGRFIYEETDDQLRAVQEIKQDMERARPMDRLLCGDVGVGKTEVALRAAFKAVSDGYQVAILVPTTILAWQHFNTLRERMEPYPVKVAMLSRFTSQKDMKSAVSGIGTGGVDIAVGTHRLLQKDIRFKKLGLVIIDEEQRFGVGHKEALKERFAGVDVLTLSATPIPRTLNMAMNGIRDMSVIEQPPQDRLPIMTYVLEYDEGVISGAIRRELARGGQVYYLHNRVETISRVAAKLQEQFPEAAVEIAHGQMSEQELSAVWRRVMNAECDILVCTTIIETGVDVANCNTLIIEDANRLGLAQLYQIRGRVGRSGRRAYAYFTFRRDTQLSEVAQKRLAAIRDFTSFGSGFRIAMRDLQIRGAGGVLSARQSGHLAAVGYETYLQILNQAISDEQNGESEPAPRRECVVSLAADAYLPEGYVGDERSRIEMYKRIAGIGSAADAQDVLEELSDRFGRPPETALRLVHVSLARALGERCGFYEIRESADAVLLYTDGIDRTALKELSTALPGRVLFSARGKSYLSVTTEADAAKTAAEALSIYAESLPDQNQNKKEEPEP